MCRLWVEALRTGHPHDRLFAEDPEEMANFDRECMARSDAARAANAPTEPGLHPKVEEEDLKDPKTNVRHQVKLKLSWLEMMLLIFQVIKNV